jgi:acyl-CoA reductase-like NAD-dependent aldehyde dehydrogenase
MPAAQQLLVDGEWRDAATGATHDVVNAFSGEVVTRRAIAKTVSEVVFKGSEQSPRVHAAIVEALADADVPAGLVNFLTNDPADAPQVVARLIEHPQTAHVNFTGSSRVGRIVAGQVADEFTNLRWITVSPQARHYPI